VSLREPPPSRRREFDQVWIVETPLDQAGLNGLSRYLFELPIGIPP
jgi:hypothetical protein